ncbi:hypothetical protein [Mangrovimonas cancribranchiae]|uniref:Uncharacterized protein n=1 Tax=Mangrovimonas cancribranchiae TaxID=3080055 RepID=A0AAU6P5P5_9FLAO
MSNLESLKTYNQTVPIEQTAVGRIIEQRIASQQEASRLLNDGFSFQEITWTTAFTTVGVAIGGPIGGLVGGIVGGVVDSCTKNRDNARARGINLDDYVAYPLTGIEEVVFLKWFDDYAVPTFNIIIEDVDAMIESQGSVNQSVIDKANEVFKALAVMEAYKDRMKSLSISFEGSENIVNNKVSVIEFGVNAVRNSLLDYLEENTTNYEATTETITASSVNKIGEMSLFWKDTTVTTTTIKFVETTPNNSDASTENTNTGGDENTGGSSTENTNDSGGSNTSGSNTENTNTGGSTNPEETTETKKFNWGKLAFFTAVGIGVSKLVKKDKK